MFVVVFFCVSVGFCCLFVSLSFFLEDSLHVMQNK